MSAQPGTARNSAPGAPIPGYAECHFCKVRRKRRAWRCRRCIGGLDLRERLLHEAEARPRRRIAPFLSLVLPGLGHWYAAHPGGGLFFFGVLAVGVAYYAELHVEFNLGRGFGMVALALVWVLAALDARRGGGRRPPPCQEACPNQLSCMGYVQHVREGRFRESLELVLLRCPFPGAIGRVCHHPCEKDCRRGVEGEAIAICALKRFVSDEAHAGLRGFYRAAAPPVPTFPEKVAVVGAGPAGLSASLCLRILGFSVTVFEAAAEPGGMPDSAIPDYRLPREVYRREIDEVLAAGIELRTGRRLGADFVLADLKAEGYAAAYLAIGAARTARLPHCGTAAEGFLDGLEFLQRSKAGAGERLEGDILVIGGGNVAMDVAKTALRCGATSVRTVFLETRETMPAHRWECEEAMEEGVIMIPAAATVSFEIREGRVAGALCRRVQRIELDEHRRLRPVLWEGTDFTVPARTVFTAVGSGADFGFLPAPPARRPLRRGSLTSRLQATETGGLPVFLGGDCLSGPSSMIAAIAAGFDAAREIYLALGKFRPLRMPTWDQVARVPFTGYADSPDLRRRRQLETEPASDRCTSFCEVCHVYPAPLAVAEAERCLRCRWTISKPPAERKKPPI